MCLWPADCDDVVYSMRFYIVTLYHDVVELVKFGLVCIVNKGQMKWLLSACLNNLHYAILCGLDRKRGIAWDFQCLSNRLLEWYSLSQSAYRFAQQILCFLTFHLLRSIWRTWGGGDSRVYFWYWGLMDELWRIWLLSIIIIDSWVCMCVFVFVASTTRLVAVMILVITTE